jgi:hypothetical protein
MTQGWICVHRQLLEWEWFSDHNTFRLFVYFMLKANHQDKKWKGILIKRGQHLTSLDAICAGSGLTKSQVRTSIKKLKSTHEIAHESNKQHTVITVINYNLYQSNDTQVGTQVTHESHTNSTQVTPNNNDNNEKNNNIHQQIADKWNEIFKDELSLVSKVTQKRKSAINGCIAEMKGTVHDFTKLETWSKLFTYAKTLDFLMGRTKEGWTMGFDFITTKSKLIKIVEGDYDNK